MSPILHLSDTHFGTETPAVVQALLACAATVQPGLVLVSGDITQRARRGQFAAAKRFLDSLGLPVLTVAGNHDIPLFNVLARCFAPYGNYRRYFGPALEPTFEDQWVRVIGVNSTRARRHKHGELSASQIARVSARLRAAGPRQLRIVMLHHPLRARLAQDEGNLARGHALALEEWVDAGADLILGGHIHLPYVMPVRGRATARGAWVVQAGTAVSSRVRGTVPNSFNLIHCSLPEEPACRIERWDYHAAGAVFTCSGQTSTLLSREGRDERLPRMR